MSSSQSSLFYRQLPLAIEIDLLISFCGRDRFSQSSCFSLFVCRCHSLPTFASYLRFFRRSMYSPRTHKLLPLFTSLLLLDITTLRKFCCNMEQRFPIHSLCLHIVPSLISLLCRWACWIVKKELRCTLLCAGVILKSLACCLRTVLRSHRIYQACWICVHRANK